MFPQKFVYLEEQIPGPRVPCIIALRWEKPLLKFGLDPDYLEQGQKVSEESWNKFRLVISSLKLEADPDDLSCDGKQIYFKLKMNELDIEFTLLNPNFPDFLIFREAVNTLTKSRENPEGLLIDDEDFEDEYDET